MKREKKFSQYLLEKYANWMTSQEEVKSPADFAKATGVNRQTILKLMEKGSDIEPQLKTVQALAKVVGEDIYDFLEISQSDIQFDMVTKSWDTLPDNVKESIAEIIKPYLKQ